MPTQPRVIRILIASPSDVDEEREAIPQLFLRWNNAHSQVVLLPQMYETGGTPTMGDHPQHILNSQLIPQCELAVAVFWSKLGTPTPTAKSGTIEEIREFIKQKGPQRVMVYFCERPLPHSPGSIDTGALSLLQDFKKEMQSQCLFQPYTSVADLEKHLYHHLDIKVNQLIADQLPTPDEQAKSAEFEKWWNSSHSDARLRRPFDFGATLPEICIRFAKQMDEFDAIKGTTNDKFLDLGAHVYRSVAMSLQTLLKKNPYSMPFAVRSASDRIIHELKDLASAASNHHDKGFCDFWQKGRRLSNRLNEEVQTVEKSPTWTM